jgi:hypothetical protein
MSRWLGEDIHARTAPLVKNDQAADTLPNGRWLFARIFSGRKSRLLSQLLNVNIEASAAKARLLSVYEKANPIMFDETFSPDSR